MHKLIKEFLIVSVLSTISFGANAQTKVVVIPMFGDDAASTGADPAQVVWVAKSGDNTFPLLSSALASISDASALKPYLIKIAPGLYDEGTAKVSLKNFVDIEGSGQGVTTITSAYNQSTSQTLEANGITAELRNLTVNATSSGNFSTAIRIDNVVNGSFSLFNVTANASGARFNRAIWSSSSPTMTNVTVTATGTGSDEPVGLYQTSSSSIITNLTATATGGIRATAIQSSGSTSLMRNVVANASGASIANIGINSQNSSTTPSADVMVNVEATGVSGSSDAGFYFNDGAPVIRNSSGSGGKSIRGNSATVKVADTVLDGPVTSSGSGTFVCTGAYNVAFIALDTDCTPF